MGFLALGPDVLLRILRAADVHTVVQTGMVCRALHELARSKQLWIALLSRLKRRGLVALPPHATLSQYSTHELVALVKRVVLGPFVWQSLSSSPNGSQAEEILHRFPLPLKPSTPGTSSDPDATLSRAEALPGGRHVLIERHNERQELWDVAEAKCIWDHDTTTKMVMLPVYEREEIVVCMFERAVPVSSLAVVVIDLATNTAAPALRLSIPDYVVAFRPHFVLSAYAPLVALETNFIQPQGLRRAFIIIDMNTSKFCVLKGCFVTRTVQFLPSHVAVLADPDGGAETPTQINLIFYALADLTADLWLPLVDLPLLSHADLVAPDNVYSPAPLNSLTQTFFYATDRRLIEKQLELVVHSSVLHSNTYLLSWYCGGHYMAAAEDGTRDPEYTFARYHFRPGVKPSVTPLTSTTRRFDPHWFAHLGFAGSTGEGPTYAGFARRIHNPYSAIGFDGPLNSAAALSDRTIRAVGLRKLAMEPYTPVVVAWWEEGTELDVVYLA
ncbi:hypothetical protein MIND_00912500 [Mycena indigotica]|uniref:F-box domain-containing protein n=1 Tax=Mycena indigotica TaxID=2126181 RepID=A0A8H6SFC5_9AGAR|nr:uncharacterized protein MIND_00912500 [Mycena indigotica]KAF7296815.1 hypothetical protein MIND_00912500 [Mycena indigotica]